MIEKLFHLPELDFTDKKQGFILVLVGILVALILATLANTFGWATTWMYWVLIFGIVIGILNIFHEEGVLFLVTILTITFMLNLLADLMIFPVWIVVLFNSVVYLLAPAGVVVGLKVVYALATK